LTIFLIYNDQILCLFYQTFNLNTIWTIEKRYSNNYNAYVCVCDIAAIPCSVFYISCVKYKVSCSNYLIIFKHFFHHSHLFIFNGYCTSTIILFVTNTINGNIDGVYYYNYAAWNNNGTTSLPIYCQQRAYT
jgi:hypothetical protein